MKEHCPGKSMCILAVVQKKARKAGEEMGMVQLRLEWISQEDRAGLYGQIRMVDSVLREIKGHLRDQQRGNLHFKISSY